MVHLTQGCIEGFTLSKTLPENAVVQILSIAYVTNNTATGATTKRARLMLSDGMHVMQTAAMGPLQERIDAGEFREYQAVRIMQCARNDVPATGRWVLIITDLAPVQQLTAPIGDPKCVSGGAPASGKTWSETVSTAQAAAGGASSSASASASASASHHSGPVVRQPNQAVMGAGGGSSATPAYQPVSSLNPYTNRWTIKVRVTNKNSIKEFNNARGPGKLFSCDLLDERGDEVRATFFGRAVDTYFPLLEKDGVYFMGNGKLKVANKQYTTIKHEYEINFDEKAVITPAPGDDARIARIMYNFVKLSQLENAEPKSIVDVLGVVVSVGQATDITSKAGKNLHKRDVAIADDSGIQVALTFWGERADMELSEGDVVAIKGAPLGDYGGRSLSTYNSTIINVNPTELPAANALRAWWASAGGGAGLRSISDARGGGGGGGAEGAISRVELRRTVSALRDEQLANQQDASGQMGAVMIIKGTVMFVREDADKIMYPACPKPGANNRGCNKKMTDQGGGSWQCPNCGPADGGPKWRYIMSAQLGDGTGQNYITLFDDSAVTLVGKSADELRAMQDAAGGNDAACPEFTYAIKDCLFKEALFTIKLKMEMVKDEQRIKATVLKMRPIEFPRESRALLDAIKKFQPVLA